jgi:hypothetical protein
MRKLCITIFLLLALAAAPFSFAQQKTLLPDHFGAWSATSPSQTAKPDGTTQEQLDEAGLASSQIRSYSNGGQNLTMWIFQFHDPSGAYEIYTSQINTDMRPSTVGNNTAVDRDTLLALVGNLVVKVSPVQSPSTAELQQLIKSLSLHSDRTPLPPIRAYLPQGFMDGTQKYSLGPAGLQSALRSLKREEFAGLVNEAGFSSGAEAMVAQYKTMKDEAVLLLIEYPTPQLAEQHLRHLEQAISAGAKQSGTTIERKASLLSIVLRPSSVAYAGALREAVNYDTSVTWHEPTHTITDPPFLTTVAKIIIATLFFMVVAVVLGLAFGGVRVLAKTFFPGKFFDRPEQMDVLQLGLSSKRIDSRDFY